MKDSDIEKTALTINNGKFNFLKLPFAKEMHQEFFKELWMMS